MNLTKINGQNVQVDELNLPQGISLNASPNLPLVKANLAYNLTDNKLYYSDGTSWIAVGSNGTNITVTGITFTNSTPSYTPALLNYYEVFSTSYAMSGCANVTFDCTWTRIGNIVTLNWGATNGGLGTATTSSGTLATVANTVPARFLKVNQCAVIVVLSGALNTSLANGNIYFLTGGSINITNSGNTPFPNPGFCGFMPGAMTYTV